MTALAAAVCLVVSSLRLLLLLLLLRVPPGEVVFILLSYVVRWTAKKIRWLNDVFPYFLIAF